VKRFQLNTVLVSASPIKVQPFIKNHVVKAGFNSADDWIAEQITKNDLLATADIELADRALKKNAFAIDFKGGVFDDDNIGRYKASRDLMGVLRDTQFDFEKKLRPRTSKDSSEFANGLNNLIQKIIRNIEKEMKNKQFDENRKIDQ
jgi:uncharacterized protein YaiI (UPF0178 family)